MSETTGTGERKGSISFPGTTLRHQHESEETPRLSRIIKPRSSKLPDGFREMRIRPDEGELSPEAMECLALLARIVSWRQDFLFRPIQGKMFRDCYPEQVPTFPADLPEAIDLDVVWDPQNAIFFGATPNTQACVHRVPPSMQLFYERLHILSGLLEMAPLKSFCRFRLHLLQIKFEVYLRVNAEAEQRDQMSSSARSFHSVGKVDNHIHAAACMNPRALLRFIKEKMVVEPDSLADIGPDGRQLSLRDLFHDLGIEPYDLSLDTLDVHADNVYQRFDHFNAKFSIAGHQRLRKVFLKTTNLMGGRYFAEMLKQTIASYDGSECAELRLSVYGRSMEEWDLLARWFCHFKLGSEQVRYMVQIPRLYSNWYQRGDLRSFEQFLKNVFQPLFEVTLDPTTHPHLHFFLEHVVGFDSVDDESIPARKFLSKFPLPQFWTLAADPPFSYYLYYMYANLYSLNELRVMRGWHPFALRPHAGEAGETENVATAFLLAHGINHGIQIRHSSVLEYLYYVTQLPMSVSPASNNSLFLGYQEHPFKRFFARGLNVALSTDDPLQFHLTQEPLMEEYSIAAHMWQLSSTDLCEIARNSVLMSGFDTNQKQIWLGPGFDDPDPEFSNMIEFSNIPDARALFRHAVLVHERELIERYCCGVEIAHHLRHGLRLHSFYNEPGEVEDDGDSESEAARAQSTHLTHLL